MCQLCGRVPPEPGVLELELQLIKQAVVPVAGLQGFGATEHDGEIWKYWPSFDMAVHHKAIPFCCFAPVCSA